MLFPVGLAMNQLFKIFPLSNGGTTGKYFHKALHLPDPVLGARNWPEILRNLVSLTFYPHLSTLVGCSSWCSNNQQRHRPFWLVSFFFWILIHFWGLINLKV